MNLNQWIRGDRAIWISTLALMLISLLVVYSASSTLAYRDHDGRVFEILLRHFVFMIFGVGILYMVHRVPIIYLRNIWWILLPVTVLLLIMAMVKGQTIGEANASRWIAIPFVGVTFQPSELAKMALVLYLARDLAQRTTDLVDLKKNVTHLFLPLAGIVFLIFPSNLSTALLVFTVGIFMLFVGGVPVKHLLLFGGVSVVIASLFILTVIAFPNLMPNRVQTWQSRIESYMSGDAVENYQVTKAKTAIATGKFTGKGPGKSVQKHFLPQSSSDFIYAVIIEEYGLIGGGLVWLLYVILTLRFIILSIRMDDPFVRLVVIGLGTFFSIQALINMGVAVNLFPVTGQTLPLMSAGGSSLWITCVALGIILSASQFKKEEVPS